MAIRKKNLVFRRPIASCCLAPCAVVGSDAACEGPRSLTTRRRCTCGLRARASPRREPSARRAARRRSPLLRAATRPYSAEVHRREPRDAHLALRRASLRARDARRREHEAERETSVARETSGRETEGASRAGHHRERVSRRLAFPTSVLRSSRARVPRSSLERRALHERPGAPRRHSVLAGRRPEHSSRAHRSRSFGRTSTAHSSFSQSSRCCAAKTTCGHARRDTRDEVEPCSAVRLCLVALRVVGATAARYARAARPRGHHRAAGRRHARS